MVWKIMRIFHTGMEISVKNHTDELIFHTAICAGASQISLDATIEIAFANFYCAIPTLRFGMERYYETGIF